MSYDDSCTRCTGVPDLGITLRKGKHERYGNFRNTNTCFPDLLYSNLIWQCLIQENTRCRSQNPSATDSLKDLQYWHTCFLLHRKEFYGYNFTWMSFRSFIALSWGFDKGNSITVCLILFKITVLYGPETWCLNVRIGDVWAWNAEEGTLTLDRWRNRTMQIIRVSWLLIIA